MLQESVFVPDEIDEDLLFPEELEKFKNGEPLYPPGEEPGRTITRLSQNFEQWQNWWQVNQGQFDPDTRYRPGKPFSPAILLEIMESGDYPNYLRQLASDELVVGYSIDIPFEAHMPVKDQKKAFNSLKDCIERYAYRFKPGHWYVNGQESENRLNAEKTGG
jgi:hypothetical protein